KILWTFSEPVHSFRVTASVASDPAVVHEDVVETGQTYTASNTSTEWPSMVAVPSPGCWTFTLTATTTNGQVETGTFTYVAVA
ncbi:MAG: hypothetical protein WBA46_11165, partial [Thermomicrobiales bacterium]